MSENTTGITGRRVVAPGEIIKFESMPTWEEEFDELYIGSSRVRIKAFIQSLLDEQKKELLDYIISRYEREFSVYQEAIRLNSPLKRMVLEKADTLRGLLSFLEVVRVVDIKELKEKEKAPLN